MGFCTRIGVAWVLRDPIIVLVLLLVLVLQPICAGALAMWRFSRRSLQWCVQVCGKCAALGQSGDVLAPVPPGELLYRSVSVDVVARPESSVLGARSCSAREQAALECRESASLSQHSHGRAPQRCRLFFVKLRDLKLHVRVPAKQ